jgi:hypothetical protein
MHFISTRPLRIRLYYSYCLSAIHLHFVDVGYHHQHGAAAVAEEAVLLRKAVVAEHADDESSTGLAVGHGTCYAVRGPRKLAAAEVHGTRSDAEEHRLRSAPSEEVGAGVEQLPAD